MAVTVPVNSEVNKCLSSELRQEQTIERRMADGRTFNFPVLVSHSRNFIVDIIDKANPYINIGNPLVIKCGGKIVEYVGIFPITGNLVSIPADSAEAELVDYPRHKPISANIEQVGRVVTRELSVITDDATGIV